MFFPKREVCLECEISTGLPPFNFSSFSEPNMANYIELREFASGWKEVFVSELILDSTLLDYIENSNAIDIFNKHRLPKPCLKKIFEDFHQEGSIHLQDWRNHLKPYHESYLAIRNRLNSTEPDQYLRIFYTVSDGHDHFQTQIIKNDLKNVSFHPSKYELPYSPELAPSSF